ncbi:hypothetical protein C6497_01120 [Candidatus Poribacteria bacterium]|nr:MAG: hypothetical protein C6497_01120 [Candidatus Poribacteria bacterium]
MAKYLLFLAIILVIIGIGTGIYYEFSNDSTGDKDNNINWKRGFFRLTLIISILAGLWLGSNVAIRIKNDNLDIDDEDFASKLKKNPVGAFIGFFILIFGFVWLIYFIFQWPIYQIIKFVVNGFR